MASEKESPTAAAALPLVGRPQLQKLIAKLRAALKRERHLNADLLAACKRLMEKPDNPDDVNLDYTQADEAIDMLRAAIQKAERRGADDLEAVIGTTQPEVQESLRSRIVAMMKRRGWSTHWIHRSAYLHLEAAELAEAVRGKRGDTLDESGDALMTLLALSPHELPEIVAATERKLAWLLEQPPYAAEQLATEVGELGIAARPHPDLAEQEDITARTIRLIGELSDLRDAVLEGFGGSHQAEFDAGIIEGAAAALRANVDQDDPRYKTELTRECNARLLRALEKSAAAGGIVPDSKIEGK